MHVPWAVECAICFHVAGTLSVEWAPPFFCRRGCYRAQRKYDKTNDDFLSLTEDVRASQLMYKWSKFTTDGLENGILDQKSERDIQECQIVHN
ncbi:hypothetical protein PHET_07301 [Paragonimus heterotremus]|uniref:Uncharacterized protein n=1 Tax=Paragonimus heterotremus TaxID=100268 RepID=A0A8J4SX65_9TREM|nr:hypothetical protein PHET_07301 [Paragonimus heterotremus]